jgi:Arylsulfotransferase (ASST)
MRALLGVVLVGCTDATTKDTEPTTDSGTGTTDTVTDTTDTTDTQTTDTVTTDPDAPAALEVTCATTTNALRFECTVTVDPPQPVTLTYVRTDGESVTRTVEGTTVSGTHVLGLYFMAPQKEYTVSAFATAWPDLPTSTTLTTGTPPAKVQSSLDMTGTATMNLLGTHLPCAGDAIGVVYDTNTGDLVWYQQFVSGGTFGANDMLSFTEDHTLLGESEGDVIELDLMGQDVVRLINLSDDFGISDFGIFGNFHHDIHKQNGVYYGIFQESFGGGDVLDNLVLFDATGAEITRWRAEDHLPLPGNWGGDFMHTNAIDVDANGDIYLSFLGQNMVVKLEGDTSSPTFGEPLWMLDGLTTGGGLTGDVSTTWTGIPAPASFSSQHSFHHRADGRVQLLDNNNGRGLVISVDEVNKTATVDGAYDTAENVCGVQGTSRSTQSGNPVIGCLGDTVREYDITTGAMLWQAEVQCVQGGGFGGGSSRFYPLDGW